MIFDEGTGSDVSMGGDGAPNIDLNNLGGQMMQAIYAYGLGKVDAARTRVANSILPADKGFITQPTNPGGWQSYLPVLIALAAVVVLLGLARR